MASGRVPKTTRTRLAGIAPVVLMVGCRLYCALLEPFRLRRGGRQGKALTVGTGSTILRVFSDAEAAVHQRRVAGQVLIRPAQYFPTRRTLPGSRNETPRGCDHTGAGHGLPDDPGPP